MHWSRFGLDYTDQRVDLQSLFARPAPVVLEIGFGNGAQLLHAAVNEPARNFIGIEVHRPGVGRLMNDLAEANVDNIRISNHDAQNRSMKCVSIFRIRGRRSVITSDA